METIRFNSIAVESQCFVKTTISIPVLTKIFVALFSLIIRIKGTNEPCNRGLENLMYVTVLTNF